MKIITTFILSFISLILAGILTISGLTEATGFGFIYWFFVWMWIVFLIYKRNFKTQDLFRFYLIRKFVILNSFFHKIDKKMTYHEDNRITPIQEKAVKLWKLCLKDKNVNITCSIALGTRQIEKDNLLIILSPINQLDYLMSIIDGDVDGSKNCIYEIRIGQKLSSGIISAFDIENEKRMKDSEESRRKFIHSDLDNLLLQEEESLRNS